ncbi:MAG TPA: Gfo/Idh/MocA family oxidoreductase [Candidatus Anammoximicrobium sp.]|nr:Gfo/Idh/MocA family oxidoreductase [Candidatus Anammoximicrobium sp.]
MIRIGIVGCGRIMAAHLRGYRLLREAGVDDFRITAVCSLSEDEARMYVRRGEGPPQRPAVSQFAGDPLAVADEYVSDFQDDVDVQVYTDFRRLVAEAPITAVNDFTNHALHHQVAEAALGADKDLLTEKPMAVSVRAARRMCELAESHQRVLGVFQSGRYMTRTRHLQWLFDSGRMGSLQIMLIGSVGARWAPDFVVADTPWRHRRVEGGGISLDVGVHRFDLIRALAGEIRDVQARTAIVEPVRWGHDEQGRLTQRVDCDAEDTVYASFATAGGATGELTASWAGRGGGTMPGTGDVYYASGGRVCGDEVVSEKRGQDSFLADPEKSPDPFSFKLAELYERGCPADRKARHFPLGLSDPFALAQYEWLEAVRERRPPETNGRDALASLACAFTVLEAAQAGRRVEVDEVASGSLEAYQREINEHYGIA